jgi:hypothetical protein
VSGISPHPDETEGGTSAFIEHMAFHYLTKDTISAKRKQQYKDMLLYGKSGSFTRLQDF